MSEKNKLTEVSLTPGEEKISNRISNPITMNIKITFDDDSNFSVELDKSLSRQEVACRLRELAANIYTYRSSITVIA